MDKELQELLHSIPAGADYAATAGELDPEDIPPERIQKVRSLLVTTAEEAIAVDAACLLCSWGCIDGLEALRHFLFERQPADRGWKPHRLGGHDDTYRLIALALERYYACRADEGDGDQAREGIFPLFCKVLEYSAVLPFEVPLEYLVRKKGFVEYVQPLKDNLLQLLDSPNRQAQKIEDVVTALLPFDSDFVTETLASRSIAAPPMRGRGRGES